MTVKQLEFYTVEDVKKMLKVQETKAYRIIRSMNRELEEKGKITIAGRIPKKYFDERLVE